MRKKWIGLLMITVTAVLITEMPRSDYSLIQKVLPIIQIGGTVIKPWQIVGILIVVLGTWLLLDGIKGNTKRFVVVFSSLLYFVLMLTAMENVKSTVYKLGIGVEAVEVLEADLTLYSQESQMYAAIDVHLKCHKDYEGSVTMNTQLPPSFVISEDVMNEEPLTMYNIRKGDVININQVFPLKSVTQFDTQLKEILIYEDYRIILQDDSNVVEVLMNESI